MLKINPSHLLENTTYIPSPFFNERPEGSDIFLLVIHHISLPAGNFEGDYVRDLFTGDLDTDADPSFSMLKGLEVSAHCFVRRNGRIIQFVPFDKRAWHAGRSIFQGRENCNDFSIGIELEGTGEISYTDEQYKALAELTRVIMQTYPQITKKGITGHENIAPDRKTDPGPSFDWKRYLKSI